MIAHEAIRMDGTTRRRCELAEQSQVPGIILRREEALPAVHAALDEMQSDIGQHESGCAWHEMPNGRRGDRLTGHSPGK